MAVKQFVNNAQSQCNSPVTNVQGTVVLQSTAAFPTAAGEFVVRGDDTGKGASYSPLTDFEYALCTLNTVGTNTLTLTRGVGVDGTTARAFLAGSTWTAVLSVKQMLDAFARIDTTNTGLFTAGGLVPSLANAAAGARIMGSTNGGPPTAGAWNQGDIILDKSTGGYFWCSVAGTPGTWLPVGGALTSPSKPSLAIAGGAAGAFSYEVVAVNAQGDAIPSPIISTSIGPTTLDATHTIQVNWTAPLGCIPTNYKVIRTAGGPSQGIIATVSGGATAFIDNGVAASVYTAATVNPGGGFVIGGQSYRMRAHNNAGQALAAGNTTILFQVKDFDPANLWSGNNTFTAPVAGYYSIQGQLEATAAGVLTVVMAAKNGVLNSWGRGTVIAAQGAMFADTGFLNAGETLIVNANSGPGGTTGGVTGASNYVVIEYLGS